MKLTLSTAAIAAVAGLAHAQDYDVRAIDLDPDIIASMAMDITSDGRVVGVQGIEGGKRSFGFVWQDGVIQQLIVPQPGNFSVFPRTLDIHHHVAVLAMTDGGYYSGVGSNMNFGHSFQPYFGWLPHPDPYPPQYLAADVGGALVLGIADTTPFVTAVGTGTLSNNRRRAFISQLSKTDDVGDPPRMTIVHGLGGSATESAALAVNIHGTVVGYAANSQQIRRPFSRTAAGVMTDLGTLGGPSGRAQDISDSGHIVGRADVSLGTPHAFLIPPGGTMQDLGTLGGATSWAYGVNNHGHVVGESWTADGQPRAFLHDGTAMIDLNTRIPPGSGWLLTHAEDINDDGMIVGWGWFEGRTLAFVLQPSSCRADLTTSSDPNDPSYGVPDGVLDGSDFFYYLDQFAAANLAEADLTTSSDPNDPSYGIPDGILDGSDFFYYLDLFAAGCP